MEVARTTGFGEASGPASSDRIQGITSPATAPRTENRSRGFADKPAETHLIEAVPVKVEKSAKIPANALATGLVSDPKPEIEKAAVKMEEDVKSESAKPVESVEKETSVLGSEDKALSKDASQVHSVVEPTDTKKRLVEVVADQGLRTWKKRCLVEK